MKSNFVWQKACYNLDSALLFLGAAAAADADDYLRSRYPQMHATRTSTSPLLLSSPPSELPITSSKS